MNTVSVKDSLSFGWETFKKRPFLSVAVVAIVIIISGILSSLGGEGAGTAAFLLAVAVFVINVLIEMGLISFALKAHDDITTASLQNLWHPQSLWQYLVVKILTGIIVIVGLVLLIVPGIIAALALIFATYLVIDRNLGPIEALKESMRLTKGHRWNLFLLALSLILLNVLGAIALLVGLLVTIPVSLFAVAHAYRTLAKQSVPLA